MLTKKEFISVADAYRRHQKFLDKAAEVGILIDNEDEEYFESTFVELVCYAMELPIDKDEYNDIENMFYSIKGLDHPEKVYDQVVKNKFYSVEDDEEPDEEALHQFEAVFGFNLDDLDKILKVR